MHFYLRRHDLKLEIFCRPRSTFINDFQTVERIPVLSFCITSILLAVLENSKNFCFDNSTIEKN